MLSSFCRTERDLEHLLHFISHKLNFSAYNNLHRSLAGSHNACHSGRFDLLFIYKCIVFDLQTKSCDTVVERLHITLTAETFQNDGSHFGEIAVGKNRFLLCLYIVILSAGCL